MNLNSMNYIHISQVPLVSLIQNSGATPILLSCLLPGIELVIWKMRRLSREPQETEFRQAALKTLDLAIDIAEPGAIIHELDGCWRAFKITQPCALNFTQAL